MQIAAAIVALARAYAPARGAHFTSARVEEALSSGMTPGEVLATLLGPRSRVAATMRGWKEHQIIAEAGKAVDPWMRKLSASGGARPLVPSATVDEAVRAVRARYPQFVNHEEVREAGGLRQWASRYLQSNTFHTPRTMLDSIPRRLGVESASKAEAEEGERRRERKEGKESKESPARGKAPPPAFSPAQVRAVGALVKHYSGTTPLLTHLADRLAKGEPWKQVVLSHVDAGGKDQARRLLAPAPENHPERHAEQVLGDADSPTHAAALEGAEGMAKRDAAEVADAGPAVALLRAAEGIEARLKDGRGYVARKLEQDLRELKSNYAREFSKLESRAAAGEAVAPLMARYRSHYAGRVHSLRVEAREAATKVEEGAREEARKLLDSTKEYRDWRYVARRLGNFTGEHSGAVRRAFESLSRVGGFTLEGATSPPLGTRETAAPKGRQLWLDEAQRNAGWGEGELSRDKAGREEMARVMAPVISAVKQHIGTLTLQSRKLKAEVGEAARLYAQALKGEARAREAMRDAREGRERRGFSFHTFSDSTKELVRRVEVTAARLSEMEERIQKAHEDWLHLEEIVESGVTPGEGEADRLRGLSKKAVSSEQRAADARARLAGLVRGGSQPELHKALMAQAEKAGGKDKTRIMEELDYALRVVGMAEEAYDRQVRALPAAQRPGTTEAVDSVILTGKYAGMKFSQVPVSHVLWLATGARIKKEESSDVVEVSDKLKVRMPYKVPRTFYQDIERQSGGGEEDIDPETRRQKYSNLPRFARRYLRSAEGARRVEAWRKEYEGTPWEDQVHVLTGQAPELDERYTKYQRIMALSKAKGGMTPAARQIAAQLAQAAMEERSQLQAQRESLRDTFTEEYKRQRERAMAAAGVARFRDLPAGMKREVYDRAKGAYEAAVTKAGLSEYSVLYRAATEKLGLLPEDADWHAKNALRDSAATGRFRTTMAFQDSNLTEKAREEMEREGEADFRESQRKYSEFARWASDYREAAGEAEDAQGPEKAYRRRLDAVRERAKKAYEEFVKYSDAGGDSRSGRRLPMHLRAEGGAVKEFDQLTWVDVFRLGRAFHKENELSRGDFLIPESALAFHPGVVEKAKGGDALEQSKSDPRWRATSAEWYGLETKGAAIQLSKIQDAINNATSPRQLDNAFRSLLFRFYGGPGSEEVAKLFDQDAGGKSVIADARALARDRLDLGAAHPLVRAAVGDYVVRRHDILTGKVAEEGDFGGGRGRIGLEDGFVEGLAYEDDGGPEVAGYEPEERHLEGDERPTVADYLHDSVREIEDARELDDQEREMVRANEVNERDRQDYVEAQEDFVGPPRRMFDERARRDALDDSAETEAMAASGVRMTRGAASFGPDASPTYEGDVMEYEGEGRGIVNLPKR